MTKLLTIGMAVYDDFHGVWFSLQALRMYHSICATSDVEFIVVDNNPSSEHGKATKSFIEGWVGNQAKYIEYTGKSSTFNKYKIVDYANGKYVLIMDCHILLAPNSINTLLNYYNNNPDCKNLVQGPLWYDDLKNYSTEFKPGWSGQMYGTWHSNNEAYNKGAPFEIQFQGMGLCSFEKKNWPGISPYFKGFGAEEGYIHEKFRRAGGKAICIPQLKWAHRFGRPDGVKYPLILEDRVWNYLIGWLEITQDPESEMVKSILEYFTGKIPQQSLDILFQESKKLVLNVSPDS